ncbi:MAG: glycosyltransferase family 4 protein [Chloroflexi bacterium]|nr:glycosyltransferase family 4 protein [Chloroflexota bacterium]
MKNNIKQPSDTNQHPLRIAIITALQSGTIGQGQIRMLSRFPDTLTQHSSSLYFISGWTLIDGRKSPIQVSENMPSMKATALKYIPCGEIGTSIKLSQILSQVDVVIFFLSGPYVLPASIAKLARKKTIFVLAGLQSKETRLKVRLEPLSSIISGIFNLLEHICFKLVDRVAAESSSILHWYGLDKYHNKFMVFGAAYVDTSRFSIHIDVAEREPVVGYVGRFSAEKGIMNFVEAIPLVLKSHEHIRFIIAGDGALRSEVENQIKIKQLENKVTLRDWIPHNEIPNHLNTLKLIVSPSFTEGLPPLVQEAMACGTPVLATSVGGIPDIITDSHTGFILENNSPECIARNIIRALDHPNLPEITRNARTLIETEYSYETTVEKYVETLNNLFGSDIK